ncbi:MAG TPA: type II secretion system protein [Propionicimonas sp.]|nr:type II secretion system protein [Propionicimonas sp.]
MNTVTSHPTRTILADQAGVSLVEIVVAMFILAMMSIGVLPLMMGAVAASAGNRDLVAATSLVNGQLAALEAAFPNTSENSCAAVSAAAAAGITDPSGSGATAAIVVGECPAEYPGTVAVRIDGYGPDSTKPVVELTSEILVVTP